MSLLGDTEGEKDTKREKKTEETGRGRVSARRGGKVGVRESTA